MSMDELDRERFAAFVMRMRSAGIHHRELMAAVESTPRYDFVPAQWRADAWSDRMVPIECGETIEGLDLQIKILAALDLEPGHRVLEIGTGSGFTAAIMGRLTSRVLSLERFKTLTEKARQRHETLGLSNVMVRQADGANGAMAEGPFDRIVAWAAYESLPRGFVDQLATGGVMVAAIGPTEGVQIVERLSKLGSRFDRTVIGEVRFQPMATGIAAAI